jgi:molybdate transport repressor ModE-like protein
MDIYQVRTFVTVAQEGSITRASELLFLSQPAVSAHIKAMEDELGLVLFERTPRGMSLTGHGTKLLTKAEQLLAMHRDLLDEARRITGRVSGKLRLGSNRSTSAQVMGKLLTRLSETCPV